MNTDRLTWRSLGTGAVGLTVLLVLLVAIVAGFPAVVGAEESYVVVSSSMEPAIGAGDLVVVESVDARTIREGDVITFKQPGGSAADARTTHRVVAVQSQDGSLAFQTQGDANSAPDSRLVPADAVIGAVSFHVPFAGYLVSFANSGTGILALIVVPAGLLLVLEVRDLLAGGSAPASDADADRNGGPDP
jgi:signal peptidase